MKRIRSLLANSFIVGIIVLLTGCFVSPVVTTDILSIAADPNSGQLITITQKKNLVYGIFSRGLSRKLQYFDPTTAEYTWIADVSNSAIDIALDSTSSKAYILSDYGLGGSGYHIQTVDLQTGQVSLLYAIRNQDHGFDGPQIYLPRRIVYNKLNDSLYIVAHKGIYEMVLSTLVRSEIAPVSAEDLVIDYDRGQFYAFTVLGHLIVYDLATLEMQEITYPTSEMIITAVKMSYSSVHQQLYMVSDSMIYSVDLVDYSRSIIFDASNDPEQSLWSLDIGIVEDMIYLINRKYSTTGQSYAYLESYDLTNHKLLSIELARLQREKAGIDSIDAFNKSGGSDIKYLFLVFLAGIFG